MFLEILAFIYGVLIKIIDDIYDSNLFLDYKLITDVAVIGLTLFFFLYDRIISFFGSGLYTIGGITGLIIIPRSVDANIWRILIYLAIPIFIYHLFNLDSLTALLMPEDITQFLFTVMPIIVVSLILMLIEDYLVPEEYGNKKLYDKLFQVIATGSFIYFLNFSSYFSELTDKNRLILNIFFIGWLGNVIVSTFMLLFFTDLLKGVPDIRN
jgi:hypothetical protein